MEMTQAEKYNISGIIFIRIPCGLLGTIETHTLSFTPMYSSLLKQHMHTCTIHAHIKMAEAIATEKPVV